LSNDERAIRRSRGISIVRLLPFLLAIIAVLIMSTDQQLFLQCIGRPIEGHGRGAALIRLAVAIPCSVYYVRDFSHHRWVIATFCVGIGLAIPQIFWLKRHKAYWDTVREKEKLKRAEVAAKKKSKRESATDGNH